mmetsp:Transcript_67478/g.133809  ORF Transcript_67478/g.133809 Transcript_67478/m.133809 type:complete len:100 (+) Transcript_67478:266-565(+)
MRCTGMRKYLVVGFGRMALAHEAQACILAKAHMATRFSTLHFPIASQRSISSHLVGGAPTPTPRTGWPTATGVPIGTALTTMTVAGASLFLFMSAFVSW